MINEEKLVEEYTKNLTNEYKDSLVDIDDIDVLKEAISEAYLAGRQEKWHDLRKNPKDLPEPYLNIVNQEGEKVRYDYINEVWRNDDADEYICDDPIAWCEIPTFKE